MPKTAKKTPVEKTIPPMNLVPPGHIFNERSLRGYRFFPINIGGGIGFFSVDLRGVFIYVL